MAAGDPSSKQAFRTALTPAELRALQVLHVAMPAGVLLFFLVVLALALQARPGLGGLDVDTRLLNLMSLIHAAFAGVAWALAPLLFSLQFRGGPQGRGASAGNAAERAIATLRGALLLRLALLEAPALLGLIICLLASGGGAMREQPLYWLNASSAFLFIAFAALSFPTRARVEAILSERFLH